LASWRELEVAAPELAARGRDLIVAFRFLLVGTIRQDGTPRISPVEARLVAGELMLAMIPGTLKVRDLLRDPRLTVNAPVTHPDDPNRELKLRGRAREVADIDLRRQTADAIEAESGWRPGPDWHFVAIDIEDAAHIAWKDGVMTMMRWSRPTGLEKTVRPIAVLADRG
jgi:hypothetical protein